MGIPSRLHHNAYVTRDMEATRKFYCDLIGLPLLATWTEVDQLFGKERVYCHCFFGMEDGSALTFFQFANKEDEDLFGPKMPFTPFHHIAFNVDPKTQGEIEERAAKAGYKEPEFFVLDHGYCRSIYITDPNGMIMELTTDNPIVEADAPKRKAVAEAELKRWLAGDHHSNNTYRVE
jgi:glyoxylase I family protein